VASSELLETGILIFYLKIIQTEKLDMHGGENKYFCNVNTVKILKWQKYLFSSETNAFRKQPKKSKFVLSKCDNCCIYIIHYMKLLVSIML